MNAEPDARLVAAALKGSEGAFSTLDRRHRRRAQALANGILHDWAEAEDVAQEALLEAYGALARLRDPDRFGAWVAAIAANLAKMRVRARRAGWTSLDELVGGRRLPELSEPDESRDLLRGALQELPVGQREAIVMHYLDGFSTKEIAAIQGESPGAVRVRLHRARGRLREQLAALASTGKEVVPMIELELEDVVVRILAEDEGSELPRLADPQRVVLLRERGGERILPIWIGAFEGDALALQLRGGETPRPLTPDLMARLLDTLGGRVERVAIAELRENTFYALVTIVSGCQSRELDARPSDALNLAARVGAPIYATPEVLEQAGTTRDDLEDEACRSAPTEEARTGVWRSLTPELVKALWPKPPTPPTPPEELLKPGG